MLSRSLNYSLFSSPAAYTLMYLQRTYLPSFRCHCTGFNKSTLSWRSFVCLPPCPFNLSRGLIYIHSNLRNFALKSNHQNSAPYSGAPANLSLASRYKEMKISTLLVEISCSIYSKLLFFTAVLHCITFTVTSSTSFFMLPATNEFDANTPGFDSPDHNLAHYTLTAHSMDMMKDH